jgi:methionyl-tRNA formyltransferase
MPITVNLLLLKNRESFQDPYAFVSSLRPDFVNCPITDVMWDANLSKESIASMVDIQNIPSEDPNSDITHEFLANDNSDFIVYSGPPGVVLDRITLSKPKNKILHCHPGIIPMYKGSTTIFYSALLDNSISATLFEINDEIDSGKVLTTVNYKLNNQIEYLTFESVTDSAIRWRVLEKYLLNLRNRISLNKQKNEKENTFYICHPVIRSAIYLRSSKS